MKTTFLDFEQSIADLESKIEELRFVQDDSAVDIAEEIGRLEKERATDQGCLRQADAVADFPRWRAIRNGPIRWTTSR